MDYNFVNSRVKYIQKADLNNKIRQLNFFASQNILLYFIC